MRTKHLFTFFLISLLAVPALAAQTTPRRPKLVVQIVVSQMRYDYLERFGHNFIYDGFKSFMENGTCFTDANYNYMQTTTEAGLATLTTGTDPSMHGIVGPWWVDFTTSIRTDLIEDYLVRGLDCESGDGRYSPRYLTVGTLGDRLKESDPESKVISIALSPASAIVAGGSSADVYWCYDKQGTWVSSTHYFPQLPRWVQAYNELKHYRNLVNLNWEPSRSFQSYVNTERTIVDFVSDRRFFSREFFSSIFSSAKKTVEQFDIDYIRYSPFGNSLVTHFAREAILREELGKDDHPDLLTICYDSPRLVSEFFGPRSIEVEDMFYKLDAEIGELINAIHANVGRDDVLIVLTSDHGASDTFKEPSRVPMGRFNADQFKMIMNGFLSAQYEPAHWIVDYGDRQLYLNRELIYRYGFDLAEVQTRAANFALQFRGISAALTSTALQSGYFGKGYAEKMQNSFYPRRSGDIIINLMPGWIEERENVVSTSGSMYGYDIHVPLMFLGGRIGATTVDRPVDMTDLAPTLARILRIDPPNAATGSVMREVIP